MPATSRILITGAAGYLGHQVGNALAKQHYVLGCDIRHHPDANFAITITDICDDAMAGLMRAHQITHVIHLASIVDPSDNRERDYQVDVEGTRNVIEACIQADVQHLTVTSSGAAYGYHEDNDPWLSEQSPIRGNYEFAYSWHKRLVEEMLAEYRESHPSLQQLVLRPGTILGAHTRNLITNLFMKKRILSIKGSDSPFVFIWDKDVVEIIYQGVSNKKTGVFNLAGDGAMAITDIASQLNKPLLTLSPGFLKAALTVGQTLRLTRYGPDQLKFLRFRPVLDNRALKEEFDYTPKKTSAEVFALFCSHLHNELSSEAA